LGDVLQVAETPQDVLQEYIDTVLQAASEPGAPGLAQVVTSDPLEVVRGVIRDDAGRHVGHFPMWVRFWREDLRRSLLVVLHSPNPYGEVDLAVVAHRGMLNRTVLRALFRWAFYAANWSRVVARVPADRPDLADLLRRTGLTHEGRARGGLNGADAQLWALTAQDDLWIMPRSMRRPKPAERGIPMPDPMKVH
ncbi:hypothetical protein MKK75_06975, partial [Methylobacterium sp. J-030]|uniref:hypothetical protein n=1 Tax=Methylobacterium sp. J-030 TaxID=2836627 RepID=UPI001FBAB0C6